MIRFQNHIRGKQTDESFQKNSLQIQTQSHGQDHGLCQHSHGLVQAHGCFHDIVHIHGFHIVGEQTNEKISKN
jgi:hypothetical protein